MESKPRAAVRDALDEIKECLVESIGKTLTKFPTVTPPPPDCDLPTLLRFVFANGGIFGVHTNPKLATYLHEIRAIRNDWAHEREVTSADAERTRDTVRRLMVLLGCGREQPTRPRTSAPRPVSSRSRTQRDVMREVWRRFGPDEARVVREYADAEQRGEAPRKSNQFALGAEDYARALLRDGKRKGWLE